MRTNCHRMRGRNGTLHHYYWCRNHDPLRAGGEDRRCPERNIRADALDSFVFGQVRAALLRPEVLRAGESAVASTSAVPDDEVLAAELARLDRKLDAAQAERRRVADLYPSGVLELAEVQRRSRDIDARRQDLTDRRSHLAAERHQLVADNELARRVGDFAWRAAAGIDKLDFHHRQQLMRLVVDEVRVSGWQVAIQLRIALEAAHPPQMRVVLADADACSGLGQPGRPTSRVKQRRFAFIRGPRG